MIFTCGAVCGCCEPLVLGGFAHCGDAAMFAGADVCMCCTAAPTHAAVVSCVAGVLSCCGMGPRSGWNEKISDTPAARVGLTLKAGFAESCGCCVCCCGSGGACCPSPVWLLCAGEYCWLVPTVLPLCCLCPGCCCCVAWPHAYVSYDTGSNLGECTTTSGRMRLRAWRARSSTSSRTINLGMGQCRLLLSMLRQ